MLFLVPQADEWTRFQSVSQRLDVDRSLFAFVNAMEATRTRYAPKDVFDDADVVAVDTVEIKKTNQIRTLLLILVEQLHRQLKGLVLSSEAGSERQGDRAPRRDRGRAALEGRRQLREVRHRCCRVKKREREK